ncbi:MAG: hypothetical protein Q4C03_02685, partial [bacterium]|nr:hypothetical protein [bacterium]
VMTEQDWMRLKGYSDKQNTFFDRKTNQWVTKSNELYSKDGQIDTGFLMAKCVKHAFKTYPKIQIGKGTTLESEIIEQQQEADFDPYAGVAEAKPQQEPQHFAPAPDMSAGVTVETNDDTF